jgi:hypothetical protein
MDNRNTGNPQQQKNDESQQKHPEAGKEEMNRLKPQDHLNDGTNDLANGDQEPTSASGNKPSTGSDPS